MARVRTASLSHSHYKENDYTNYTPGMPGRRALVSAHWPCASMSTQKARKDGAPAEISLHSAFLSVSYAYGNAIGIRVAGFRIPASLSSVHNKLLACGPPPESVTWSETGSLKGR